MLESLAKSWLTLQCQMIPSVQRGLVVLGTADGESLVPTAAWPDSSSVTDAMAATARLAVSRHSAVVRSSDEDAEQPGQRIAIACPLLLDGQQFGVVAVEVASSSEQQRAVARSSGERPLQGVHKPGLVPGRLAHILDSLRAVRVNCMKCNAFRLRREPRHTRARATAECPEGLRGQRHSSYRAGRQTGSLTGVREAPPRRLRLSDNCHPAPSDDRAPLPNRWAAVVRTRGAFFHRTKHTTKP